MSHYSEVQIEFRDRAALVAALERLGFRPDKIEVHQEAKALYGYQGDRREQQAPHHHPAAACGHGSQRHRFSAVLGWYYTGLISPTLTGTENGYNDSWLGRLKQAYGVEKAKAEAKKKGYRVTEEKQDDGRIRLVCRR